MSNQQQSSFTSVSHSESSSIQESVLTQIQPNPSPPIQNLISKDLQIKLSALSMSLRQLPDQINNYFYKSQIEITENRIISFQLLQLSTFQRVFTQLKQGLTKQLIEGNKTTNLTHRLQFHDILSSQLISLISISKFQLINLCLIGFDMYVKPFDAILDIVNRISKSVVEVSKIKGKYQDIIVKGTVDKEKAIVKGYDEFLIYKNVFVVSFYIQMLEEYLKKASKVMEKKQKEIIFTGCLSIYDTILPILYQNDLNGLLIQLTNLNYELWSFSNSFDYFYFYQKLPIQQKLEPIFWTVKRMVDKSLLSNTLTPFIFGVLRHYSSFIKFFETIDSEVWVKYAQGAVKAILLTFKSLSLPFKQMVDLMNVVLECSRLSSSVYEVLIKSINSPFGAEWSDIDPFFRSSLKAGYNSGGYALFHKLTQSELQVAFKQFKYKGILSIKQRIDHRLREWASVIQPNQQLRNKEYEQILEKIMKQIDSNFSLFNIQRNVQPKLNPSLNVTTVNKYLTQIRNCLSILKFGNKDLLTNKHFITYLQQMIKKLKAIGVNTRQFTIFFIQDSLSKQTLSADYFKSIPYLQLQQSTLSKFTNKIFNSHIRTNPIPTVISNLLNIQPLPSLYSQYKNQIDTVFFSQLYRLCYRYIEYAFEDLRVEDIPSQYPTIGNYFNNQQLSKILETKYRIKDQRLELISKRSRSVKAHTIKTLDGTLEIDSSLAELTLNSKKFLLSLISLIVENPKSIQYTNLLIELVQKYPIINYFVMSTTVPASSLKPYLNTDIPDYMNFSNFVIKQIPVNQRALTLIKNLMNNGLFISFNQQNLLRDFINVNVVDCLIRDIVKLSKSINKERLIKLMESLYEIIKEERIVRRKLHKEIVPAALSVLRTLIRISDVEVIKLNQLFDNLVRLGLKHNYEKMLKEIEIDHLRVNSNSTSTSSISTHPQNIQFPSLQIVIFYQDQGIIEPFQLQKQKQQTLKTNSIILDPSSLKLQTIQQHQPLQTEASVFDMSASFIANPLIDDIIGDTPIVKLQSQLVEKYYTSVYLYPELTHSQLSFVIREFFLNSSDIQPCLLNTSNSFRTVLLSLCVLLEKQKENSQLVHYQPFKSILKDVSNIQELIHKCMYLIEKAGYMKFLNQPINSLSNIPHEYSSIRTMIPQNQPIIFALLKTILSNQQLISTGFIARYPSQNIRNRCHQIFYNIKLTPELLNLILSRLPELGVQNLSFLIHSNPQSLRQYLEFVTHRINASNIHSQILNYHQLFKLTKSPLCDQEFLDKFTDFIFNIEFYLKILNERITLLVEETKSSLYYKHKNGKEIEVILNQYIQQKQNYFLNILSYLQQFVHKSNIQDILKRHAGLFKDLIEAKVDNQILAQLQIVPILKQLCYKFIDDTIILPTFTHHNRYNSRMFQKQQFQLSQLIENWEANVYGQKPIVPTNIQVKSLQTNMISYQDILNLQSTRNISYNIVKNHKEQDDFSLLRQHTQLMVDRKLIKIDHQLSILESTKTQEQLNLYKIFGFLCANMIIKNKQLPHQLSDDLKCFLSLTKLPWRLVQYKNKKIYDDIMVVLNEGISTKDLGLRFEYRVGDQVVELVKGGEEKLVNDFNKREYCNLLGMLEFKRVLPEINEFVNGFYKIYTPGGMRANA